MGIAEYIIYDESGTITEADLEEAQKLLEKAGYHPNCMCHVVRYSWYQRLWHFIKWEVKGLFYGK